MSVQNVQEGLPPRQSGPKTSAIGPSSRLALVCLLFYPVCPSLAPGMVIPELSTAFGLTALGVIRSWT